MNLNQGYGLSFIASVLQNRPGKVFFVSNVTTNDIVNEIQNAIRPDSAGKIRFLTSITLALAQCTANRGDTIFVLPGHTESVTTSTALDINKAGVSVVGLGKGSLRPTITLSGVVGATVTLSASNTSLKNVIIDATGVDAITTAVTVPTAVTDVEISDCRFVLASASAQATTGLTSAGTGDRLAILNNEFVGTSDAGTAQALSIAGGNDVKIIGNTFIGAYTAGTGAINNSAAILRCIVKDNLINNLTASSTKAMIFHASSTGFVSGNRMQILSGTAPITGAAMSWVGGNYYAATIATAGTLI